MVVGNSWAYNFQIRLTLEISRFCKYSQSVANLFAPSLLNFVNIIFSLGTSILEYVVDIGKGFKKISPAKSLVVSSPATLVIEKLSRAIDYWRSNMLARNYGIQNTYRCFSNILTSIKSLEHQMFLLFLRQVSTLWWINWLDVISGVRLAIHT